MAASFLRPSTFQPQDDIYLRKRFSRHSHPVRWAVQYLLDVREMRTMEEMVLRGNDETVMAFMTSQTGAVGMTAVASAIIAQLSSTTLQLPALSSINWIASALIIAALLFSVLATLLSVVQQQVLATLNEADSARMWLSNGCRRRSKNSSTRVPNREELEASVASLMLLRLPNTFLLCGVASFLIGFGLLLGFAWRQDLQNTPSKDSNFSVMVLYIMVGSLAFVGTGAVLKWKMAEVHQAEATNGKDLEEGNSDNEDEDDDDDDGNGNQSRGQYTGELSEDDTGEVDGLLGKKQKKPKKQSARRSPFTKKEVLHHENIANALEEAAKAHRDLANLMDDAIQEYEARGGQF